MVKIPSNSTFRINQNFLLHMKKHKKLNLKKLSIAKLENSFQLQGGTDGSEVCTPNTRGNKTLIPEVCIVISTIPFQC